MPTSPTSEANAHQPEVKGLHPLAMGLTIALIVFSTVIRGGNRAIAMIAIEWMALAIMLALAGAWLVSFRLPATFGKGLAPVGLLVLASAPAWILFLQLGAGTAVATPQATWQTFLLGLSIAAMLLVSLSATPKQLDVLLTVWLGLAMTQAALGLLQLGGAEALRFDVSSSERVMGSFGSKNTYANFLVMAIPLVIFRMLNRANTNHSGGDRQPWFWGVALLALLAAVFSSNSRAGIVSGLGVALAAVVLLPPNAKSSKRDRARWWLFGGTAAVLSLALLAGGLDWMNRFENERLIADDTARALMRNTTWEGALAHWPWGSGMGSFGAVYPRFQPPQFGKFLIDPAHSEYLQALMEMGVAFVLIAAVALGLIGQRIWLLMRSARMGQPRASRSKQRSRAAFKEGWINQDRLAVACGLGALATALHAWVDYPFRIPANAMFAAFLLGAFLREPEG